MAAFYVNVSPVFTIIDKKLNMKCSRVKATSCGKYVNMMCVIDWNSLRLDVGHLNSDVPSSDIVWNTAYDICHVHCMHIYYMQKNKYMLSFT